MSVSARFFTARSDDTSEDSAFMPDYAVEMLNITKRFANLVANDDITLRVEKGSVHALLGENGAGKSTLMSVLFGLYRADSGVIKINGQEVKIRTPNDASALSIGMVHQHFKLVPGYTVAENIILGSEPLTKIGHIDYRTASARVRKISDTYGLDVSPDSRVGSISVGMQQRVEILKTLYRDADIIVLDEPTAVLTPQEIEELLAVVKRLRDEGKTVIFITHKLREIRAVASEVTVIRRGKAIETVRVAGCDEAKLAEMMVGRPVKTHTDKGPFKPGPDVLVIDKLNVRSGRGSLAISDFSLTVRAGEIMGIAGVDGNGQTELALALGGLTHIDSGRIFLEGQEITFYSPVRRIHAGVGLSPEDRQKQGLVLPFSVEDNLILKRYNRKPFCSHGLLRRGAIKENAERLITEFDVRCARGRKSRSGELSGGNQQKVILAREISMNPKLLIICQPTRGLDVGSIEYIHKRIMQERDSGKAVLLISFELDELLNLCDRIAAISHGSVMDVVDGAGADPWRIGAMMAGVKRAGEASGTSKHE